MAAGILDHNIGVAAVTMCPINLDKTVGLAANGAFHIGQFFVVRFNLYPTIRAAENDLFDEELFDLGFQVGVVFVKQFQFRIVAEAAVYILELSASLDAGQVFERGNFVDHLLAEPPICDTYLAEPYKSGGALKIYVGAIGFDFVRAPDLQGFFALFFRGAVDADAFEGGFAGAALANIAEFFKKFFERVVLGIHAVVQDAVDRVEDALGAAVVEGGASVELEINSVYSYGVVAVRPAIGDDEVALAVVELIDLGIDGLDSGRGFDVVRILIHELGELVRFELGCEVGGLVEIGFLEPLQGAIVLVGLVLFGIERFIFVKVHAGAGRNKVGLRFHIRRSLPFSDGVLAGGAVSITVQVAPVHVQQYSDGGDDQREHDPAGQGSGQPQNHDEQGKDGQGYGDAGQVEKRIGSHFVFTPYY